MCEHPHSQNLRNGKGWLTTSNRNSVKEASCEVCHGHFRPPSSDLLTQKETKSQVNEMKEIKKEKEINVAGLLMFRCYDCGLTVESADTLNGHFVFCSTIKQEPKEEEEDEEKATICLKQRCKSLPLNCPNCDFIATHPDALEAHFGAHCRIKYVVQRVSLPNSFVELWFHCKLCVQYKTKSMLAFDDHLEFKHKGKVEVRARKRACAERFQTCIKPIKEPHFKKVFICDDDLQMTMTQPRELKTLEVTSRRVPVNILNKFTQIKRIL